MRQGMDVGDGFVISISQMYLVEMSSSSCTTDTTAVRELLSSFCLMITYTGYDKIKLLLPGFADEARKDVELFGDNTV